MKCDVCDVAEYDHCGGECPESRWICEMKRSGNSVMMAHAKANSRRPCDPSYGPREPKRLIVSAAVDAVTTATPKPIHRLSIKSRAKKCIHRDTLPGCGCDGYCGLGRGNLIEDLRTGNKRHFVTLDICLKCEHLP